MNAEQAIALAVILALLSGVWAMHRTRAAWDKTSSVDRKRFSLRGLFIWGICFLLGILFGLVANFWLRNGPLKLVFGIGAVIFAGGAIGFLGLYLGFELSSLWRRGMRKLFLSHKDQF
ncbi:MAG TPA: hypothetical protein VMS78_11940 [Rhizomicrobium sp.]|nr:hypothetical protein [Rhizomicrobium sp.]